MKLTILGSGTYSPEIDRATGGYLLEADDKKILFDFGRGVLNNLYKAGHKYGGIDCVALSHMHPDHYNDLLSYVHLLNNPPMQEAKRRKKVTLIGPEGFGKNIEHLLKSANEEIDNKKVGLKEIVPYATEKIGNMEMKIYETIHSADELCLSFRVEYNGKVFAYSGDTADSWGLRDAINDADLAVVEATMPHNKLKPTHLSGYLAGKIAEKQNVSRLVLTHVRKFNTNVLEEAKENYNGEVTLAEDLMQFEI
ncbi:MAG: MBL fold metallo-hydrolase [Candidatus Nanoarchaeia archaeon]